MIPALASALDTMRGVHTGGTLLLAAGFAVGYAGIVGIFYTFTGWCLRCARSSVTLTTGGNQPHRDETRRLTPEAARRRELQAVCQPPRRTR